MNIAASDLKNLALYFDSSVQRGDLFWLTRQWFNVTMTVLAVAEEDQAEGQQSVLFASRYTLPPIEDLGHIPLIERFYPPGGRMIERVYRSVEVSPRSSCSDTNLKPVDRDDVPDDALKIHAPVQYEVSQDDLQLMSESYPAEGLSGGECGQPIDYDGYTWVVTGYLTRGNIIEAVYASAVVLPDNWIGPTYSDEELQRCPYEDCISRFGQQVRYRKKTYIISALDAVFRLREEKRKTKRQRERDERRAQKLAAIEERIRVLEAEKSAIEKQGYAPDKCWIERLQCHNRKPGIRQVVWRSKERIFGGRTNKYIGMDGKKEHLQAIAERDRRNRRNQIIRSLSKLQQKKARFSR